MNDEIELQWIEHNATRARMVRMRIRRRNRQQRQVVSVYSLLLSCVKIAYNNMRSARIRDINERSKLTDSLGMVVELQPGDLQAECAACIEL